MCEKGDLYAFFYVSFVPVIRHDDKGIPAQIDSLVSRLFMSVERNNLILPREFALFVAGCARTTIRDDFPCINKYLSGGI